MILSFTSHTVRPALYAFAVIDLYKARPEQAIYMARD